MFAVIKTGGKQYTVAADDLLKVEKLAGDAGDMVEFSEVLMVGGEGDTRVGTPLVDGARVRGTITAQDRGEKLVVFKMKRRKGYRKKQGHRQYYTEIRVDSIEG